MSKEERSKRNEPENGEQMREHHEKELNKSESGTEKRGYQYRVQETK